MKTITTILLIAAAMLLPVQNNFSQVVNPDSVKTGQVYKILLSSDTWIEGEVFSIDSVYVKIKQSDGTAYRFQKKQIKAYVIPSTDEAEEYYENKYETNVKESDKVMNPKLSLSGGVGLTSFARSSGFPSSYLFNLEGFLYLSRHAGIRLFADCNFMGNENNSYYGGYEYYSYEEGGNLSVYIITVDAILGSLKPEDKTNDYFTCGIGAFIFSESDRKSVSSYYTDIYPGNTESLIGLKIGYGISHKFTPKLNAGGEILYATPIEYLNFGIVSLRPRVTGSISKNLEWFFEPQYTFLMGIGNGFYAGVGNGYFTLKAGVTLGSF